MKKLQVCLFIKLLLLYSIHAESQTFNVNSTQSLLKAKQSLKGGNSSAIVELASGIYFLTEPLVFNESDGRTGANYVTYKAASGANPIISGGYLVTGVWEQVSDKSYYKTTIPSGVGTEGLEYTRNLYVNGERARRARSDAKEIIGAHKDSNGNYDGITISKDQIPLFSKPEYVELQQLVRWKDHYYKVDKIQNGILNYDIIIKNYDWADTQSFSFAPQYYNPALVHERGKLDEWYFENAIELLDEPGEWYYDVTKRNLYYYPLTNEDIKQAEVIMPRLNQLIDIKSSGVGSRVKNLRFEGITFAHTNWDFPSIEGFLTLQGTIISKGTNSLGADNGVVPRTKMHIDAAVQVDGGENITFQKNTFEHIGNNGLNIHNNANNTDILRNTFKDISANAIRVSNVFNQTIDPAQGEATVSNTLIKNNYIERIGREFRGSIGIEYMYTDHIKVLHNEIRDVPYIGISGGIGWEGSWSDSSTTMTDAEISYNKIVGAMNVAKEGGSIYTNNRNNSNVSGQYGLIIRENYIDEVSYPFTTQENDRQAPIHNDEGSANIFIVKNVINTVRDNYQWAHKVCIINVDSNFVASGKTTNLIGNPRRCITNVQITNTQNLTNTKAEIIKQNAGIESDQEPPGYKKITFKPKFIKN